MFDIIAVGFLFFVVACLVMLRRDKKATKYRVGPDIGDLDIVYLDRDEKYSIDVSKSGVKYRKSTQKGDNNCPNS